MTLFDHLPIAEVRNLQSCYVAMRERAKKQLDDIDRNLHELEVRIEAEPKEIEAAHV